MTTTTAGLWVRLRHIAAHIHHVPPHRLAQFTHLVDRLEALVHEQEDHRR